MNRNDKHCVTEDIKKRISTAESLVFTNFSGLDANQLCKLRAKLRVNGLEYIVVKKTLLKRAVGNIEDKLLNEFLDGSNGIGIACHESAELAKVLVDFVNDNNKLEIKGGILKDKTINKSQIYNLAKLPNKDVLIGTLLWLLKSSVPNKFVNTLYMILYRFVFIVNAIIEKKENKPQ